MSKTAEVAAAAASSSSYQPPAMSFSSPLSQISNPSSPATDQTDPSTVASPARGAEMRNFLQARLQKNRVPPLVHSWDFYHDRQARSPAVGETTAAAAANADSSSAPSYEQRLELLASIDDVRQFWNVFNNFDITQLALRDSVHLFHKGVKPLWEDPRNTKGGSWTFRVGKSSATNVWREVCMMAIGEQLQEAVADPARKTFRDDICGISLSVRFNSMLIQIWNRDGDHSHGIEAVKQTVMDHLSPDDKPQDGSYYYKRHSEHAAFTRAN